jgi:hypothetical protein
VGAGETDHIAQVVHEQQPWLDLMLVLVTVDCRRDLVLHTLLHFPKDSCPTEGGGTRDRVVNQAS